MTEGNAMTELLMTRQRAAAHLGISVQTLDRLVRRHRLPTVRLGRAVRLPVALVQTIARGHFATTTPGRV